MVEDMVEADRGERAKAEGPAGDLPAAARAAEPEPDELSWDEQVRYERRVMEAAAQLIRDVRQSEVHRKLPHFYVVDRQLQLIENQLEDISVRVRSFWRYGRDAPMRDLLTLPVLQMVAGTGNEALVPLLGPPAIEQEGPASPAEGEEEGAEGHEADSALLGVPLDAERDAIESAYRRRSRHYHRHGRCCNIRGFHALTAARNRCLARVSAPLLPAYGTGGDILARYLLAGTDPGKSRYREYACGILDSWHRGRMLHHLQVVQWPTWDIPLTWGDEDVLVTYGGPNHMGSSG